MLESKPKATPLIPKLDLSKEISITENAEVSKHEYCLVIHITPNRMTKLEIYVSVSHTQNDRID